MILSLLSAAMVTISSCAAGAPADSLPLPVLPLNETLTNATCDTSVLRPMERQIERYMEHWHLQGVSLSIVRNDSLIYAKGFGWADREKGLKMEPRNLLRLASISKLITAVGIMVLQERGQLSLQSKVFGPEGILKAPSSATRTTTILPWSISFAIRQALPPATATLCSPPVPSSSRTIFREPLTIRLCSAACSERDCISSQEHLRSIPISDI